MRATSCRLLKYHLLAGIRERALLGRKRLRGYDHESVSVHPTRDPFVMLEAEQKRRAHLVAQVTDPAVAVVNLAALRHPRERLDYLSPTTPAAVPITEPDGGAELL